MEFRYITPLWARILVIPAMLFLIAWGSGLIYMAVIKAPLNGIGGTAVLSGFGLVVFWLTVRGWPLVRSRTVQAAIEEDAILVRRGASAAASSIHFQDLAIKDHSFLQMLQVCRRSTGTTIFTVDYYYSESVLMLERLKTKIGEQGA